MKNDKFKDILNKEIGKLVLLTIHIGKKSYTLRNTIISLGDDKYQVGKYSFHLKEIKGIANSYENRCSAVLLVEQP